MRLATFLGFLVGGCSFAAGIVYLILKLLYWDRFSAGVAPMLIGMFLLGALQLFFIGFLGEYVLSINTRVLDRPLVVEEERLNFQEETASEETAPDVQKQVEQLQTQLAQLQETLAKAQQMSGEGSEAAAAAVKAAVEETAAKAAAAMAEGAVAHG